MKLRVVSLGLAVAGAIALGGLAQGQIVPEKFVVTGEAAKKIQDHTQINLDTARRIVEGCEALVLARDPHNPVQKDKDGTPIYPVQINGEAYQQTVIILDAHGNRIYFDRMDGQGFTNIVTAEYKARTAMLTHAPSKATMNRSVRDTNDAAWEVQLGLYPVAGGLPISYNDQIIGWVGAGGYRPNPPVWSDEICVHQSMEQVFGAANVTPLIEDVRGEGGGGAGANAANATKLPVPQWGSTKAPKTSLPAEWVVSGNAAAHVLEGSTISLAAAKSVAKGCREYAASKGKTATIYILDPAREMVHMERMDGELPGNDRTALLKAETSMRVREPTSLRGAAAKNNRLSPQEISPLMFNFFLGIGGVPIAIDGQLIGSVGVSTSDPSEDENCAIAGLKATFGDRALLPVYGAAPAAGRGGAGRAGAAPAAAPAGPGR